MSKFLGEREKSHSSAEDYAVPALVVNISKKLCLRHLLSFKLHDVNRLHVVLFYSSRKGQKMLDLQTVMK